MNQNVPTVMTTVSTVVASAWATVCADAPARPADERLQRRQHEQDRPEEEHAGVSDWNQRPTPFLWGRPPSLSAASNAPMSTAFEERRAKPYDAGQGRSVFVTER
jgi:hypothetical protein